MDLAICAILYMLKLRQRTIVFYEDGVRSVAGLVPQRYLGQVNDVIKVFTALSIDRLLLSYNLLRKSNENW